MKKATVFAILGAMLFAGCNEVPFEATSEIVLEPRSASARNGASDYGWRYEEIVNTRIAEWRGNKVVADAERRFREAHPAGYSGTEEPAYLLSSARIEIMPRSRLIGITIGAKDRRLAAALANAYAEAIEAFNEEEDAARCERAAGPIRANIEKKRKDVEDIAKELLDFRMANNIVAITTSRNTGLQTLKRLEDELKRLEENEHMIAEWEQVMSAVTKGFPDGFEALSGKNPHLKPVAAEYDALKKISDEYARLKEFYTDNHPEVALRASQLERAKSRFKDATTRSLASATKMLNDVRAQIAEVNAKGNALQGRVEDADRRLAAAQTGLVQLETDLRVAKRVLEELIMEESRIVVEAESMGRIVRIIRKATW